MLHKRSLQSGLFSLRGLALVFNSFIISALKESDCAE